MRQRVRGVPGFSDSDDFLEPKVLHHPIREIFKLPARAFTMQSKALVSLCLWREA